MTWNKVNGKSSQTRATFNTSDELDLVCFSHLRWNFVYQRPQHLLSRSARERRTFYIEEPIFDRDPTWLEISQRGDRVWVIVPHLPQGLNEEAVIATQQMLLDNLFAGYKIHQYILWYYTPMALAFTQHLKPLAVIYDCMDELSLFKGAPPAIKKREAELFNRADLVFTGGQSLYEVKRNQHPNVHLFPSSIDVKHFAQARSPIEDPADQVAIPHPRLGFFGVIDERFDIDLLASLAEARPNWHFVMIGPVVKIDPANLPRRENIHYLGSKAYQELPAYLSGWDVALLLFARNDATRFISPTKTPEYLAGGKPVVSTSIQDVVHPYGEQGLVQIADTVLEFISAVEETLNWSPVRSAEWLKQVDSCLAQKSWDHTWLHMRKLIEATLDAHSVEALSQESRKEQPVRLQTTLSQAAPEMGQKEHFNV